MFLTEPSSSYASAWFFFVLVGAIGISNIIVVMETMEAFQYQPATCSFCSTEDPHGFYQTVSASSSSSSTLAGGVVDMDSIDCQCPMEAQPYLENLLEDDDLEDLESEDWERCKKKVAIVFFDPNLV